MKALLLGVILFVVGFGLVAASQVTIGLIIAALGFLVTVVGFFQRLRQYDK